MIFIGKKKERYLSIHHDVWIPFLVVETIIRKLKKLIDYTGVL